MTRYVVSPQADHDLEDQAFYYATHASPDIGHRFLTAAHETFALLASQPRMGWQGVRKHPQLSGLRVFRISKFEHSLILYRPLANGVEILRLVHGSRSLRRFLREEGLP